MLRAWLGTGLLVLAVGCGGQAPAESPAPAAPAPAEPSKGAALPAKASAPDQEDTDADASDQPALGDAIPEGCPEGAEPCVPPRQFTQKLCQGKYPSLALLMFAKQAPWQHAFIGDEWLEPINAYGGPSTEGWLRFGEEVVLLKPPGEARSGAARVIGPDDVDILRSDGTCATVTQKALTDRYPGVMRNAPIIWKYLEEPTRQALLTDAGIERARDKHKKDCKGSSETHPHEKCERAMKFLNKAILIALKRGVELPEPEKRPTWPVPALVAERQSTRVGAEAVSTAAASEP